MASYFSFKSRGSKTSLPETQISVPSTAEHLAETNSSNEKLDRKLSETVPQANMNNSRALQDVLQALQTKLNAAEAKVSHLEGENNLLKQTAERSRLRCTAPSSELHRAEERIRSLEALNQEKDNQVRKLEKECGQMKQRVDNLTADLAGSQTYAKKPDEYAGREILKMVEAANSLIFHAAMSINELYEKAPKANFDEIDQGRTILDRCTVTVMDAVGKRLYSINSQIDEALADGDPGTPEESLPLELGLQCLLVRWCTNILSVFRTIPNGNALSLVYDTVRGREEQAVSARWRSIAIAAAKPHERSTAADVVQAILALLCIAGISTQDSAFAKVEGSVRKRVMGLENQILQLKQAMQEGITSGDMEVFDVKPGEPYHPKFMKDRYEAGAKRRNRSVVGEPVLCTVEMGLRKIVMKKSKVEENKMEPSVEIVKIPDVVLESVLLDYLRPCDIV